MMTYEKKLLIEWQNKKKETITHPYLKEKSRVGYGAICAGICCWQDILRGDLDDYPPFFVEIGGGICWC